MTLFRATDSVRESMTANNEAMDLARAKGIDLASASTLIIQAMEGNSRALKQFGINLKDGLSPAEALQELQVKLAGSAQDYVNTPWGKMDVATATTNKLAATLGNDLMPVLLNFLQTVTPLIQKVTDWADAHPRLVSYILLAVGAAGLLVIAIGGIAFALSSAISIFLASMTVISAVGTAIAIIGGPITILGLLIGAFAFILLSHWDAIKLGTQVMVQFLQTTWMNGWNAIVSFFEGIASKIFGIVNSIIAAISRVTSGISSIAGSVGSGISNFGSSMLSMVPHFASGGIVTSPTMALVGEAGPEAIIPLSAFAGGSSLRGAGGGGGAGNIIVNILGGNYLDSNGAQMIGAALAKQIGRQLKVSNFN